MKLKLIGRSYGSTKFLMEKLRLSVVWRRNNALNLTCLTAIKPSSLSSKQSLSMRCLWYLSHLVPKFKAKKSSQLSTSSHSKLSLSTTNFQKIVDQAISIRITTISLREPAGISASSIQPPKKMWSTVNVFRQRKTATWCHLRWNSAWVGQARSSSTASSATIVILASTRRSHSSAK